MKKRNKKNILAYLGALLIVLTLFHNKSKENDELVDDTSYILYDSYEKGNVYICDSLSSVKKVYEVCDECDVVIVDQLHFSDPNMRIVSSYKITDKKDMVEILQIIKKYCKSRNPNWDRSISSMKNEWVVHNICSN